MTPFILKQITEFVILFYGGLVIALLWELYQVFLRLTRPRAWVEVIQNILFWILAGLITSSILYYASYGALSVHSALGFLLGATVWGMIFYGKMTQLVLWIYGIMKRHNDYPTKDDGPEDGTDPRNQNEEKKQPAPWSRRSKRRSNHRS